MSLTAADLKRIIAQPGYRVLAETVTVPPRETPAQRQERVEALASSALEDKFAGLWRRNGGREGYVRNHLFDLPESRMELDFAWLDIKVAVEVNGGQGAKGQSGHGNWYGLERDARKQNRCQLRGWTLFWLPTSMVTDADIIPIVAYINRRMEHGGSGRGDNGLLVLEDWGDLIQAGKDHLPAQPVRRPRGRTRKVPPRRSRDDSR